MCYLRLSPSMQGSQHFYGTPILHSHAWHSLIVVIYLPCKDEKSLNFFGYIFYIGWCSQDHFADP